MKPYRKQRNGTWSFLQRDANADADNDKDVEEDFSRCIGFCGLTLKTAILINEDIFNHYVNNCIFQDILERKIEKVEKDSGIIFNENTIIALMRGIIVVTCIQVWKRFLVQSDLLVR